MGALSQRDLISCRSWVLIRLFSADDNEMICFVVRFNDQVFRYLASKGYFHHFWPRDKCQADFCWRLGKTMKSSFSNGSRVWPGSESFILFFNCDWALLLGLSSHVLEKLYLSWTSMRIEERILNLSFETPFFKANNPNEWHHFNPFILGGADKPTKMPNAVPSDMSDW